MSASPVPVESAAPITKPLPAESAKPAGPPHGSVGWRNYVTPPLVGALALAVFITITRNWNAWEGGKVEQITDDAYVRGDLTPLSTKVAGIVRTVHVADFQQVHKGDLIVELQDDDYRAQVDQSSAAIEAARAAIVNNRRQRELQDARIARALAGIDQAKAHPTTCFAQADIKPHHLTTHPISRTCWHQTLPSRSAIVDRFLQRIHSLCFLPTVPHFCAQPLRPSAYR